MSDEQKLLGDLGALKSQLKILTGTVRAPRDAERFAMWLTDYALARGWGVPAADIIAVCGPKTAWQGAPSNVSTDKLIPSMAIGRIDGDVVYQISHARRFTMKMTGVGVAKHPTWAGGTQCVAALMDGSVADQPAFSALNAGLMGFGALLVGLISKRATGIPLGKTREQLVESRSKLTANFVLRCAEPGLIDAAARGRLREALAPFEGHIRHQHGVFLAWDWLGKNEKKWGDEVESALRVLDEVHAALFPAAAARRVTVGKITKKPAKAAFKRTPTKTNEHTTRAAKAPTEKFPEKTGAQCDLARVKASTAGSPSAGEAAPLQMRFVDFSEMMRRNPATGEIELRPGTAALRLPSGVAGTLVRHQIKPRQELSASTPIALLVLDSGELVVCVAPLCEGWRVVKRRGVGTHITNRSNVASLERVP